MRAEAAARGLLVADKPDSHDICFVADGDNAGWLREKLGDRAPNHGGAIVDEHRRGARQPRRHLGFTIGQRKGLRLGRPAADGKPRFVLDIEPVSGTVTVGPRERLAVDRLDRRSGRAGAAPCPRDSLDGTVQLRAHGDEHRAVVTRRRRRRRDRAARAGVRHRARPGRRDLRRHPRGRLRPRSSSPPDAGRDRMTRRDRRRLDARRRRDAFDEAVRLVLGELPDLPHLPEVPGRGATAAMTGRALAVVAELGADLQPAGWRLPTPRRRPPPGPVACSPRTSTRSRSRHRATPARSRSRWPGRGRWPRPSRSRAATRCSPTTAPAASSPRRWPRAGDHVADVRRRLPGVERLVVQVDEPALAAVLAGAVPTASGFGRHRTVDLPEASAALELGARRDRRRRRRAVGALLRRRHAARPAPRRRRRTGCRSTSACWSAGDHDVLAEALEAGGPVALGVVPPPTRPPPPTDGQVTEPVLRWLDMLGLDPDEVGERLVVTPTCGLAGASPEWVRAALDLVRRAATQVGG